MGDRGMRGSGDWAGRRVGGPGAGRWKPGQRAELRGLLGPELALETVFGFVQRALVCAGGQVLPSAVGDDERDVGAVARVVRLLREAECGVEGTTGGDTGEDALDREQFASSAQCVRRAHRVAG